MKVIVTGTTGYVGEGVLHSCLDDCRVEAVLSVSRRSTGITHPKLKEYILPDFMKISEGDPILQGYDAVLFCLGITSVGTPEDEYRLVCHDIPVRFAQAVGPKKDMTFVYLSGYGTSHKSPQTWAKVKSSTEREIASMPFKAVYWYHPCIMRPHPRQSFKPSVIKASKLSYPFFRIFGLANTIQAVAGSMLTLSQNPILKKGIGPRLIDRYSRQTQ